MDREVLRGQIRALVGEMSPLGERIAGPNDRLVEDLGYDSLAIIELSLQIESQFGLVVTGSEAVADIATVGDIEDLFESAMVGPGPSFGDTGS